MLRDLYVRNLAVIVEATVELGPGLNVLTGETGAGKSIVVDALTLLRGARASSDLLRTGTDRLVVSGRFDAPPPVLQILAAAGFDSEEEQLVVRREIGREGKNRAFINDQPATLRLLREVTQPILHIHAQREELGLATPETQRAFVDARGGAKALALLRETAAAHATYAGLAARLATARGDRRLNDERLDLLRFQLSEIAAVAIESGEDRALFMERDRLRNSEQIASALGEGHLALVEEEGAVIERLARLETALGAIAAWEPEAADWQSELEELRIRLQELGDTLRRRLDAVAADPRRLDQVEERLAELDRMTRKYGGSVDAVLSYAEQGAQELAQLEGDVSDSTALEADVEAALGAYSVVAERLSTARRKWARSLITDVEGQFADLALARARLTVETTRQPLAASDLVLDGEGVEFGPAGVDQIELQLAANPGEEPRPLATTASGGELSRIYLALRLAVQAADSSALTMVFDEADAGLGGEAASALGRKLQDLAVGSQILAVTHLAQVASFADRHLGVRKQIEGDRTQTSVVPLAEQERVEEIARMLAGDQRSAVSRSHAEELIASGRR